MTDLDPAADLDIGELFSRLRRYIGARVADPQTAADLTQEVLARSLAAGALTTADEPLAWLHRAAHNAVVDHYRTRKPTEPLPAETVLVEGPGEPDHLPNEATRELAACLRPLLAGLDPIYADAVSRVDLDGQTHEAAAAAVGISTPGMKSRVQRGRRLLRAVVTSCCAVHLDPSGAVADYQHRGGHACGCPPG